MKEKLILEIRTAMTEKVSQQQMALLNIVLMRSFDNLCITEIETEIKCSKTHNHKLLSFFISSKKVEGCSEKSLKYYINTIEKMLQKINKSVIEISTNDLRTYLSDYQELKKSSRVTIDNMRRIFSSFFSWLEDEDYILKSPVRRIHKVKTGRLVKDTLSDEQLEILRDSCDEIRDLAMIELLTSTGMRVGELVKINRTDVDFYERQIVVFGKGNSEREVYFDARTKIHLKKYLEMRKDDNKALFVSLSKPSGRLSIGGVEMRLRTLGKKAQIDKVHPHKFRRTLATMAIDKGMPIEQVQKLLGHVKIDTTMHYAMVNQTNVKNSHRKFIG
jgi:site-specific recombinase XerD